MGKAISQQHPAVVLRSRYERPGTPQADGPRHKWPVRGELSRN
jgi:hypothetical protein